MIVAKKRYPAAGSLLAGVGCWRTLELLLQLSLMALIHHRPQRMSGRVSGETGSAGVHASHSGPAAKVFLQRAELRKQRFLAQPKTERHRKVILFRRQHENEGFLWQKLRVRIQHKLRCDTALKHRSTMEELRGSRLSRQPFG